MPNSCYRLAKVLHFSGNRVGKKSESDALGRVAASLFFLLVVVAAACFAYPKHV